MYYIKILLCIVTLTEISWVETSRILMVFNHFGKSHYFQGKALGKGLAKAGHKVTMVSPFEDTSDEKEKGYNEIVLEGLLQTVGINTNFVKEKVKSNQFFTIPSYNFLFKNHTLNTLKNPKFKLLLKSKENYDVIILEDLFFIALRALTCHFKVPVILFNPFAPTTYINEVIGNPAPPSYVPNIWMGYSNHMTFLERSVNFLFIIYDTFNMYRHVYPAQNEIVQEYFPNCPLLETLDKEVSLILLNYHESINPPIPNVPSMVNILGFHLKEKNSLPKDLKQFMDSSRNGVVLFSFGSFVHPSQMDADIKKSILKSLGKLSQNVLWKTDEENIQGLPENIKLSKWLPQEDLLAHPNTKLFITHAGLVSTIETIYHAVPVLAVPLIGDQDGNAARMVEIGIGLKTELQDITENKLDNLLNELLNNDTYRKNAKKRSDLLKDRPMKPIDLAIYWVEYVIRHQGAQHLRITGLDLPWYKYLLLDVILVWSTLILTMIFLFFIIMKKMLNRFKKEKKIKIN